jgi:hypothetical protein
MPASPPRALLRGQARRGFRLQALSRIRQFTRPHF